MPGTAMAMWLMPFAMVTINQGICCQNVERTRADTVSIVKCTFRQLVITVIPVSALQPGPQHLKGACMAVTTQAHRVTNGYLVSDRVTFGIATKSGIRSETHILHPHAHTHTVHVQIMRTNTKHKLTAANKHADRRKNT